jgi:hypothetical protein
MLLLLLLLVLVMALLIIWSVRLLHLWPPMWLTPLWPVTMRLLLQSPTQGTAG